MFLTLEGPEGSGKSTQCKLLAEHLTSLGHNVLLTREPGGTEISQQVRQIIMDMKNKSMFPATEFLLFSSARAQLVREKIRPHLNAGGIVICDRYFDSSVAYQGYGHGLPLDSIRAITAFATDNLIPDLTLLLDIDPERGLRRRRSNNEEWNRLDDYELAFHRRVRDGFFELVKAAPERWRVINADKNVEELQEEIRGIVEKQIKAGK
ncbi:MAG: dTMP kinase [Chloroflexi bacterium]|nr:dTMP kinase [Chloroflexota bacterium]MBI5080750.1 dTMP kinase [Chloroflexota bacterium]MBI5349133.1 dTMP kinase [Chloroflexota bacterium]MBI5714277.1 dTMP kinase [Chloroflexota bacterium]